MISKELEITIEATIRDAEARRHEYLTVEHILFALLHDELGIEIISNSGGNVAKLKSLLEDFFEKETPKLPKNFDSYPQPTIAFRRVIQTAVSHVRSAEKQEADAGDILSAIFLEKESHAVHFLESEGISRLDVLNYISHGISKAGVESPEEAQNLTETVPEKKVPKGDALKLFTVDLVQKAPNTK